MADQERFAQFIRLSHRLDGTPAVLTADGLVVTEKLAELLEVSPGDTITLEEDSSYAEASFLGLQRFGAPTFFQGSASLFLCNYVRDRSVDFPVTQWQDRQGVFAQRQLSEAYGRRDLQAIQTLPVAAAESFLEQAGVTLADLGFWGVEDVGETVVS